MECKHRIPDQETLVMRDGIACPLCLALENRILKAQLEHVRDNASFIASDVLDKRLNAIAAELHRELGDERQRQARAILKRLKEAK